MNTDLNSSKLRVTLKRLNQAVYSGDVLRIVLPTSRGDLEIGPDHTTLFQVVTPGWIRIWSVQELTPLEFLTTGGVVEVLNNSITLDAFHVVESHQRAQVEALLKTLDDFQHEL